MIVFPLVGKSRRFSDAGYTLPKFRLEAFGAPIFRHIVQHFNGPGIKDNFLFVLQEDDFTENFIRAECAKAGVAEDRIQIHRVPRMTAGQADTVAQGIRATDVPADERIIIFNVDTIRLNFKLPSAKVLKPLDGYLEVFRGEGDHWSFAEVADPKAFKASGAAEVKAVAEKVRISDFCSNGLYYFRTAELFLNHFDEEAKNYSIGNELFVAPIYNRLIKNGHRVAAVLVPAEAMHFCGTPQEYEAFRAQQSPRGIELDFAYHMSVLTRMYTQGRSQPRFTEFFDHIMAHPSIAQQGKLTEICRNILEYHVENDSFSHYTFGLRGLRAEAKGFRKATQALRPILNDMLQRAYLENDRAKAMNILAGLINLCEADALKRPSEALKFAFADFSLPVHRHILRIMRKSISPSRMIKHVVDLEQESPTVVFLFFIYCITRLRPEADRKPILAYIERHLETAREHSKGDDKRRQILRNIVAQEASQTSAKPQVKAERPAAPRKRFGLKSLFPSFSKKPALRGALLLSGQMRADDFAQNFRNSPLFDGIELTTLISTWADRGTPPANFGTLRGYEERIRPVIREVCLERSISMDEFNKTYDFSPPSRVEEAALYEAYGAEWVLIDEEGETCQKFKYNQERLFYKLFDVYHSAIETGEFDFFVRMRPDLSFEFNQDELRNAIEICARQPRTIFLRRAPLYDTHFPFFDDNFAIAGPEAIKHYCNVWHEYGKKYKDLPFDPVSGAINPHSTLGYSLMLADLDIRFIGPFQNWKYNSTRVCTISEYVTFLRARPGAAPSVVSRLVDRLSELEPAQ
ncbi:hypothetical protein [Marinovum algicola]|nr:hypothetical protein [Marinovum algicola]